MKLKALLTTALLAAVCSPAMASTVFFDNFSGAQPNLATQTFNSGATTGFSHWPIGTSGDMGAGRFSVVNKARDIHNSFVSTLDADNNVDGAYAVYNGFSEQQGTAYRIVLTDLVENQFYTFSAALLSLTTTQFPQVSNVLFRANDMELLPEIDVDPAVAGWNLRTRLFKAKAGDNVLEILNLASLSNAGNDFGIDNVTVATAIPLPASALMGVSTLAVATLRRRR